MAKPACGSAVPLFVAIIAAASYMPSIDGDFLVDDQHTVTKNPLVRGNNSSVASFFSHDYWVRSALACRPRVSDPVPTQGGPLAHPESHKSFRPLSSLSLALDHWACGLNTRCFHATNLALHAIASALVALVVPRLCGRAVGALGAWAGGAIFAVHPVHTEAVANVSGRAELLSACFALSSVLVHPRPSAPQTAAAIVRTTVALVLLAAATLSKETGVTLGGVSLVWELVSRATVQRRDPRDGRSSGTARPLLLAAGVATIVRARLWAQGTLPEFQAGDNPLTVMADTGARWRTTLLWNARSLAWLAWPWEHCPDYSGSALPTVERWDDPRLAPALLLLAALACVALAATRSLLRTRSPRAAAALVALAATAAPYAPASHWLFFAGFTVAERVMYLPVLGLAMAAALVTSGTACRASGRGRRRPTALTARTALLLLGAAVVCGAGLSAHRSLRWRHGLALWGETAARCPLNGKILNNLGKALQRAGRIEVADELFSASIRLAPEAPHAYFNLAFSAQQRGDNERALRWYDACLRVEPRYHTAYNNKAAALLALGRHEEARTAIDRYRTVVARAASMRPPV